MRPELADVRLAIKQIPHILGRWKKSKIWKHKNAKENEEHREGNRRNTELKETIKEEKMLCNIVQIKKKITKQHT